jgi:hypothetical protein
MSTHNRIRVRLEDTTGVSRVRWRVARSGPWPAENTVLAPAGEVEIARPPLTDVEIEVTWRGDRTMRYVLPGTLEHGSCGLSDAARRRERAAVPSPAASR